MGAAPFVAMGVQAGASVLGGFARSGEHDAAAALNERNAQIAEMNAGEARIKGLRVAGMIRSQGRKFIAQTRVAQGAGNVSLTSGTAMEQVGGSAEMVELSARTAVNDGVRQALGFESQADAFRVEAAAQRRAARLSIVSGLVGGAAAGAGAVARKLTPLPNTPEKPSTEPSFEDLNMGP